MALACLYKYMWKIKNLLRILKTVEGNTMQLVELGVPFTIVLNFWEEAEKKGIKISINRLQEILGVLIVKINPIINNLHELIANLDKASSSKFNIVYDDHIEKAIPM